MRLPARSVRPADRALVAVITITGLGMIARLFWLGRRVAHFDEGRVGYWALRFLETGRIDYRFIVHGPFVQYLDAVTFALIGPSDFALRLPVALIGGLLPLAVLLYRDHLADVELVIAALFLAFNPVLLYYSRFLRSTIIVAAVMFTAFGCIVRLVDRRAVYYGYLAAGLIAIGFAAKESAVVYLLTWFGSTALLIDHALFQPRTDESGLDRLRSLWLAHRSSILHNRRRWLVAIFHLLVIVVVFVIVAGFFYAPRNGPNGVGLWRALGEPWRFPQLVEVTWGDIHTGYRYWFGGTTRKETLATTYVEFLGRFIETIIAHAGPLIAFAVIGFVVERYATSDPRPLIMFAGYWGFVSVIGYPLGTDIFGAWIVVNALVPLALPAAVGVGLVVRRGREAVADSDRVGIALAAVLFIVVVAGMGSSIVTGVYLDDASDDNPLVQYAQPGDGLRPSLETIRTVAPTNPGVDVILYGTDLTVTNPTAGGIPPPCADLSNTLPLQWYFEMFGARATCVRSIEDLETTSAPIVIGRPNDRAELASALPGYTRRTALLRTVNYEVDVFVDQAVIDSSGP